MEQTPKPALYDLLMQSINLSQNGIAVLDAEDRFLFHNQSFARMFDIVEDSMIGRTHQDFIRSMFVNQRGSKIEAPTLDAWMAYVYSHYRSVAFRSFEVDLKDERWLLVTEQICPGGELIVLCSDITRQKDAENALRQAHEALERLALSDELTGVPNRRNFLQQLEQECAKSRRYQHPLSLAMLDLDHFKRVNDRFGHAMGDEVLKHFAQFLSRHLRAGDVVGRLGGEEFAVLLPETELNDALIVLNRMIEQLGLEHLDHFAPGFTYSFSGGVVLRPPLMKELDCSGLLAYADQALYQAKAAGRNQVVAHHWELRNL